MHRNSFVDVIVRSYARAQRIFADPLPSHVQFVARRRSGWPRSTKHRSEWPHEHCASEPFGFVGRSLRTSVTLCVTIAAMQASAAVHEVGPIELTVHDLNRELHFFTNTLPFTLVSETRTATGKADDLLDLRDSELRTVELQLGNERIRLTEHLRNKGRAIPPDSRSYDHWFQHIAIVVSDMDRAYARMRSHKVKHVSTAPQTLPAWNRDAGGITAFYFLDPEDHVLELIHFPPGKGDPKWQQATTNLFLGIDHTAIVVSDTDRSLAFYTNVLGLQVAGGAENHGVEQEHLNQVFGARLRITALRAERGPGIEFLEYITPPGGRPLPSDARANDLIFWRTHLVGSVSAGATLHSVSRDRTGGSLVIRDPDGHALQIGTVPGLSSRRAEQAR